MAELNTITDPNLPEPKGVADASNGQIYVSDGAGSGSWVTLPTGWGYYVDDSSEQTFDTTASKLLIDGAGSSSESSYLPLGIRGSGELWDTSSSLITPIAVADAYTIRVDLPVTAKSGSPNYATLSLDIGGGATPSVEILKRRFDTTRSAPYGISITMNVFTLSTFLANGGQFFIKAESGSIGITAPHILITRTHGEV